MPEEAQDVNEPLETDPSPSPEPEASAQAPTAPATETPSSGTHMVPSGRLKEEADKRRAAEQQAQQLQTQVQQLQANLQKAVAYMQQTRAPQAVPPANGKEPIDSDEQFLADTFGTDEAGQKARRAVRLETQRLLKEMDVMPRQEALQMVEQAMQMTQGRWTGTVQVANRLQNLVQQGLATGEEMQEIHQDILQRLQQPSYASVANNPQQLDYLVSDAIARRLEGKKFSSVQPVRPKNPLQPSNTGAPPEPPTPEFEPSQSPFASIQHLKNEDSRKLTELSERHHKIGR